MKKNYCKFCGKQFQNMYQVGGHQTLCHKNPSYQKNRQKALKTIKKNHNFNIYQLNCKKCGEKYQLQLTLKKYQSGKYTKHCSRSCANSRNHSLQTRMKMSKAAKTNKNRAPLRVIRKCQGCQKIITVFPYSQQKYCSMDCARKNTVFTEQRKKNISKGVKRAYRDGRKVVQGGNIK